MKSVIKINNVWKKYKIGTPKKLTEAIPSLIFKSDQKQKEFWALRGINLNVQKGEIVGIIGPNGSGKSTLLRIISGITHPTKGTVEVNGKIASLLELGAGFHPELTGRENIFLYGSILGISAKKVQAQLSDIVAFSGIGKFIDTPVKHYSSGMYIRLAFSVAIHLEFDILLIDEVLTVGDAEFQKKSLEKIQQILKQHKTIIIVSHDLSLIPKLCKKAVFVSDGKIEKVGIPKQVINYYLKQTYE